ncbi:helix-turn-helix domain-containing protein [Microcoleus sp. AR_TQ3_B6]|uniref:helix-turn-helix domain-containing protein n=1 Tax=Microcoleus sp. AR_TQ3_B6 TaxID=3055284 RepID=UPI002FD09D91
MISVIYAIKLELKLNNKERSLMARHSGYARFGYNYALALYQRVKDWTVPDCQV